MLWRETHPALHSILIVIWAYFLFSISDSVSKWLTLTYPVPQIILYTCIIGFIICVVWMLATKGPRGFISPRWRWHILRGISLCGTAYFVVFGLAHTPLAEFYSITFLSPLLISLMSALIFKEGIGLFRLSCLLIGFAGVVIIAGPQFSTFNIGFVFTFLAALCLVSNALLMRVIGDSDPLPLYLLYGFGFNILVGIFLSAGELQPVQLLHWPIFVIAEIIVMFAMLCVALAFARAPESSVVAPFQYTQLIWGVLIGLFVFNETPSLVTWAGSVLIIGAGLAMIWREHTLHKKIKTADQLQNER